MKPTLFTSFTVFLATLTTLTTLTNASLSISHFNLLDARTKRIIRKLTDGDVIKTTTPITIAAIPATLVKSRIVYKRPFHHVSRTPPYILSKSSLNTLFLVPKEHHISAYVDDHSNNSLKISVTYHPTGLPSRGPRPNKLNIGIPPPPPVKRKCALKEAPIVKKFSVDAPNSIFHGTSWTYSATVDYCTAAIQKLRFRILSLSYKPASNMGEEGTISTEEWESFETLNYKVYLRNLPRLQWCGNILLYFEACALSSSGDPVCGTSEMKALPPLQADEPLWAFRPPIRLHMAPGDTAKIVMHTSKNTKRTDAVSSDKEASGPFMLGYVFKAKDGYILKETAFTLTNITVANVSGEGVSGGLTLGDNGGKIYLKFARPSCIDQFGTYEERYPTKIIVSEKISPLVKQDRKLPTFEQPKYPRTVHGKPVTITVKNAKNVGGGQRADGSTPKLHYQWYVRRQSSSGYSYAEPIRGATGRSLPLAKAQCSIKCDARNGIVGLREYYVDVCNTYGCRLSEKIEPRILAPPLPPGRKWDKEYCVPKGKGVSCSNSPYCMVGGVAKECWRR